MTDGLLDTSFFIDVRRGRNDQADAIRDAIKSGDRSGSVSAVTAYELWVGNRFSREEEILYESMFALLESVAVSTDAAKTAGIWLRTEGDRSELLFRDALIASCASLRGEAIITRNVRDFSRFTGLRVETY